MLGRIIFCVVIAAAVLAVVLLATVSPLPGRHKGGGPYHPWTLTVYIHPTASSSAGTVPRQQQQQEQGAGAASAFVFRHRMTAGPESASRTVGAATGFVLPGESGSAMSVFDTVHLAFDVAGMSGSVCVQAAGGGGRGEGGDEKAPRPTRRRGECGDPELLLVVGGTGAFAFVAGGEAVLRAMCAPRLFGGVAAAKVFRLELSVAPASKS